MDITAAAIATIISSSVATIVTIVINRKGRINNLEHQLDEILKIGIQYPYLECPNFTKTWIARSSRSEDDYLRYENYCTLIFNYLSRLSKYYKYNKTKIETNLNVKDWIRTHKLCWENPSIPFENSDSYNEKFKKLIDGYLS